VRVFATPFVFLMFGLVPVWVGLLLGYHLGYQMGLTPIAGYCPLLQTLIRTPTAPVRWSGRTT
jgi:hypothetical protein